MQNREQPMTEQLTESKHERKKRIQREWHECMKQDPEWVEKERKRQRERYDKNKLDPKWVHENNIKRREKYAINRRNREKIYRERKQQIIDILGGGCSICGYDKYIGAIDLHETEKIFNPQPARYLKTKKGYQYLLDNIDKLIPLCSNCHREYHNGVIDISGKPLISKSENDY